MEQLQQALPQYEITAFIARGGMGAVYKGNQRALKRPVAIKVLPPDLREGDLQFAERFKHEAQAMARLTHPNIVAVHDAGETANGLLYFVMEFIEGTDVAQIIASSGRLRPAQAVRIITAVCEALAFSHEEGIVHRDIKPSNIMIDRRGRVKVADFGLAKSLNLDADMVTSSSVAMGTPDFIAPEVLIPGLKVDGRADLYAVGVMLYQMLTGTIPRGRFAVPSGIVPEVDKRFDSIVDKAMQTDREHRYSTATEMKHAVESVVTVKDGSAGACARTSLGGGAESMKKACMSARTARLITVAVVLAMGVGMVFLRKESAETLNKAGLSKTNAPSSPAAELPKEWIDGTQALREAGIQAGKLKEEDGWLSATQEDFYFKLNEGLESEDMAVRLVFDGSIGSHLRKQYSMSNLTGYVSEIAGRQAKLVAKQTGPADRIAVMALSPAPSGQSGCEMIFVVRGGLMSQWVDGKLVNSIKDEKHKRGWAEIKIFASNKNLPATRVRKVEYAFWDAASADVKDASSSPAMELPKEWMDGTRALREAGISTGKLKEENGFLKVTHDSCFLDLNQGQPCEDIAVRVIFSGCIGMKLRKQEKAANYAGYMGEVLGEQGRIIAGETSSSQHCSVVDLPPVPAEHQEREMVFLVRGNEMTQWVNGKLVNSFKDNAYKRGGVELAIFANNKTLPGTCLRKVEYAIWK